MTSKSKSARHGVSFSDEGEDISLTSTSSVAKQKIAASPHWSVPVEESSGFSPFIAFCFTVNYIVGTGFLTIPWGFVQGGLAFSTVLLVLAAVGSDIAKDYLLETMSRAEVMLDNDLRWIAKKEGEKVK